MKWSTHCYLCTVPIDEKQIFPPTSSQLKNYVLWELIIHVMGRWARGGAERIGRNPHERYSIFVVDIRHRPGLLLYWSLTQMYIFLIIYLHLLPWLFMSALRLWCSSLIVKFPHVVAQISQFFFKWSICFSGPTYGQPLCHSLPGGRGHEGDFS